MREKDVTFHMKKLKIYPSQTKRQEKLINWPLQGSPASLAYWVLAIAALAVLDPPTTAIFTDESVLEVSMAAAPGLFLAISLAGATILTQVVLMTLQ